MTPADVTAQKLIELGLTPIEQHFRSRDEQVYFSRAAIDRLSLLDDENYSARSVLGDGYPDLNKLPAIYPRPFCHGLGDAKDPTLEDMNSWMQASIIVNLLMGLQPLEVPPKQEVLDAIEQFVIASLDTDANKLREMIDRARYDDNLLIQVVSAVNARLESGESLS
ncbi:hypothetical protein NIES2135_34470 [Leptolyngbya boryana NIES-2135]|jgi:hypothetical protein|uniref:Uncharacterized protein n=1 Tax=Leptolyngbya boryana NIES-2135 TaxID=1973484 RepID=A0A1Z4JIY9_LEPBY|nr:MULTISPECIES: hypothetical protein [Leptolyngbya]BAY56613.1 hypothetical protein NIES2135_34470 [Leptolyngbya boryana NIES-2135]MBD2369917.1 hypothetical protein [Leptolyngbya sp. FACHB-161]MBD2376138.1 hypothetical protein [Leptolyngbya sp. FACHB-238]MBD2400413.1 hypothetical protein [Leptolyngbya sp. FACHB-239]MBD2406955.1 hypothetical protein [Leptolyngbya sp. FACHB-402]